MPPGIARLPEVEWPPRPGATGSTKFAVSSPIETSVAFHGHTIGNPGPPHGSIVIDPASGAAPTPMVTPST